MVANANEPKAYTYRYSELFFGLAQQKMRIRIIISLCYSDCAFPQAAVMVPRSTLIMLQIRSLIPLSFLTSTLLYSAIGSSLLINLTMN